MSQMNLDQHGRHRNVTVAFRVSPEEAKLIDAQVAMSGMTKQDYITSRLLNREVKVVPSSRLQKALQEHMDATYRELRRIRDGTGISPELEATLVILTKTFAALGVEPEIADVDKEDAAVKTMARR